LPINSIESGEGHNADSDEAEIPNNRSEEAKLIYVDALHPERSFRSGQNFLPIKRCFKEFLFNNLDVFAWSPTDMPGIDPAIICHWLAIDPKVKLVKQKPRKMNVK